MVTTSKRWISSKKTLSVLHHLGLLIVVTLKIAMFNTEDGLYARSMNKAWNYYFNAYGWNDPQNNVQLFTVNDTVHAMNSMLETYGDLNNISLAEFSYRHHEGGYCQEEPAIIKAETVYWQDANSLQSYMTDIRNTTDLAFITNDAEGYFASLDTLSLTMYLCNTHSLPSPYKTASDQSEQAHCYLWEIDILYRFVSQVYIMVEIQDRLVGPCKGTETATLYTQSHSIKLEIASIVLSALYFFVVLLNIRKAYRYYLLVFAAHAKARLHYLHRGLTIGAARTAPDHNSSHPHDASNPLLASSRAQRAEVAMGRTLAAQLDWEDIPFTVKWRFMPVWLLGTLLGVILCAADACYRIANKLEYIPTSQLDKFFLGVSCFLIWGCLLQFMTMDRRVYAIVSSFSVAAPRLFPYFMGVLPVFFAFVFFAIAYWGSELGMFSTFPQATKTLFSLMNGDSIFDMVSLMKEKSVTVTALFATAFMVVAFYLIMNIVIAIVEEAYFLAKTRRRHLETLIERRLAQAVSRMQDPKGDDAAASAEQPVGEEEDEIIASLLEDGEDDGQGRKDTTKIIHEFPEAMCLTREELVAEVHMLGRTHFEYSKIMDFLSEHVLRSHGLEESGQN